MKHVKREQFIWNFHNYGKIPSCYEKVFFNNKDYVNKNASETQENVLYISLVPTYLNFKIVNHELFNQKKIIHLGKNGAGILIDGDYTTDSYLKKFTKKQLRTNLKRAINRLEASFNITYEYNFGDISVEKCDFLLAELRKMLEKRFQEKNMENMFLKEWDSHTKDLAKTINDKKASLFVVYSDEKPISISVNSHINNNILLSKTNGFDTDYTKFSLGHLDIYLLLDWCIKNSYHFLDLGLGIPDYKKKWCNLFYDFEYHIYYKKNVPIAKVMATIEIQKIKLKNIIKNSKIIGYISKTKALLKNERKDDILLEDTYNQERIEHNTDCKDLNLIDIKQPEYDKIRKTIFDYLYSSQLHIEAIKIFKHSDEAHNFIVKSDKESIRISLQSRGID